MGELTCLHLAVLRGHTACVEEILRYRGGAGSDDPCYTLTGGGEDPLLLCCKNDKSLDCMKALLKNMFPSSSSSSSPSSSERGGDVTEYFNTNLNNRRRRAIDIAARNGSLLVMKFMVKEYDVDLGGYKYIDDAGKEGDAGGGVRVFMPSPLHTNDLITNKVKKM